MGSFMVSRSGSPMRSLWQYSLDVESTFIHVVSTSIYSCSRDSWKARCRVIFQATKQHAFNLAKFVSLYKTLLLLQRKANGGKERSADTFIAGLIGGYVVFGDRTAVNEQVCSTRVHAPLPCLLSTKIVLYVVSRVIASFLPRAGTPYSKAPSSDVTTLVRPVPPDSRYFSVFAALAWGAVMWLFKHRGQSIQPGMFNSMTYLYRDSEVWKDLRTLLWHNT